MSDQVQVNITLVDVGLTRQGFGMPLYVSHTAAFADRVRFYAASTYSTEMGDDGFAEDSPERRWANAVFAQSPKPPQIAIGRANDAVPTKRYSILAATPRSSYVHNIGVTGEGVADATATYTSGASATAAQIHNGLVTALNAVADKNFTAAFAASTATAGAFTATHGTETFTKAAHGFQTGDGPFQLTTTTTLPAGLSLATDYWVIRTDANDFQLATSLANALTGTAQPISDNGTGTHTITPNTALSPALAFTVTGDAPGEWFALALSAEAVKNQALTIHENHAAPAGLSDALDDIFDEDDTWYQIHDGFTSTAVALVYAEWAEAHSRTYVFATNDTDVLNVDVDVGTDIGAEGADAEYTATSGMYSRNPAQFAGGRWMGRWLPTDPGKATAALKTLVGLDTEKLTSTQKTNLKNRRMQTYSRQYGRGFTTAGMVFSTTYRYLDTRRDVHWLIDEIERSGFETMQGSDKVPYTKAGMVKIEGALRGSVTVRAVEQGVLAEGTTEVIMPEFETIPNEDKADRVLRHAQFKGTLTGAVEALIPIDGTLTF